MDGRQPVPAPLSPRSTGQAAFGDIHTRVGWLHRPRWVDPALYRPGHLGNVGLPVLGLLAGCSIPPRPPSPDPIQGGTRLEGRLDGASPARAAFCVSQEVPLSYVLLISDGGAVRPAPGTWPAVEPGYALTLRRSEAGTTWLRQVGEAGPSTAAALTGRIDRALAGCTPALGKAS